MKTLTNLLAGPQALAVAALFCATALHAEIPGRIEVHGQILLDGASTKDARLTVVLEGVSCALYTIRPNGDFKLQLPAESMAILHFSKPGYLSKDIVVDTRNAMSSTAARKRNSNLEFDVQMQPMPFPASAFANPVGTIRFIKGSGLMKVAYDRTLVMLPGGMDLALLRDSE